MFSDTSSASILDVASANAILSVRSLVMRDSSQRSCLVPYDWSKRYGKYLGSYVSFIRSKSPDIFIVEEDADLGLYFVRLSKPFQQDGYLKYQRIADSGARLDSLSDCYANEDPYSVKVASVLDPMARAQICGVPGVFVRTKELIRSFIQKYGQGGRVNALRRLLSESGIPPIPLEWFENDMVITKPAVFFLKKSQEPPVLSDEDSKLIEHIDRSDVPCGRVESYAQKLCISVDQAAAKLKSSTSFFYQPDMVFSCAVFETLVEGYLSPDTRQREAMRKDLDSMSPFMHLVKCIDAVLVNIPEHKLRTEYILAWCAALDVNPKRVWECLQHKVVWGSRHSDMQVFFRKQSNKQLDPQPSEQPQIPRDVSQGIRAAIRDLIPRCTIDKLVNALRWGKNSENRKKYGTLPAVIAQLPDLFYDPTAMHSRSQLEHEIIVPGIFTDADSHTILKTADNQFVSLAHISASLVYFLSQEGCESYPRQDAVAACSHYGINESNLSRLSRIFVPGSVVYLRTNCEHLSPDPHSLIGTVFFALKASGSLALEFESMFRVLNESMRFESNQLDRLRHELVTECGNLISSAGSPIAEMCYYNPNVVILDSAASLALAIQAITPGIPVVSDFKMNTKEEAHGSIEDDSIEVVDSVENIAPDWCKVGVIVNIVDSEVDQILVKVNATSVSVSPLNKEENGEAVKEVPFRSVKPRIPRVSDKVLIVRGSLAGRTGQLLGLMKSEASVQFSRFDFKSFPVTHLVPFHDIT